MSHSLDRAETMRRIPGTYDAGRADALRRTCVPNEADAMRERLREQYRRRFASDHADRNAVWSVLVDAWFSRYLRDAQAVLDLGCGWGHFINNVDVPHRFALDLNPDARAHLDPGVRLLLQEASQRWPLEDGSLDVVFTSNFLEHLPDRDAIASALCEAGRCLRPGGRIVCLGPNIRCVGGAYWDFFDHLVPLTERSLAEALEVTGFRTEEVVARFLPFTMVGRPTPPAVAIRAYLRLRPAWRLFGRQFLVVGCKPV